MKTPTPLLTFENKDTKKILSFLKALPHLQLSETGKRNICKRFGITTEELHSRINELQKHWGRYGT